MTNSGIFIVKLKNSIPMSIHGSVNDRCAKVNFKNIFIGSTTDLYRRQKDFVRTFKEPNVEFIPVIITDQLRTLDIEIQNGLIEYRVPSCRKWLVGIEEKQVLETIYACAERLNISFKNIYPVFL